MTATEVAFPVGATTQELVDKKGTTYDVSDHTVTRTGEDGAIPILHMNVGDSFNGEILEGGWHKGWDSNIDTFTASIDSGILRLTGVAKVAGTAGNGWINSHQPIPLLDELELTVSMEVPVDDTGVTNNRDLDLNFIIKQDKDELKPTLDDNRIRIRTNVTEGGLILFIHKEVNGVNTTLASGYDHTMDTTRSTGDLEATIWRLVFNGKPGTEGAIMSVYLKQSDTLANAESATEHEVTGSPFDVSDLAFNVGYPSYEIRTQNTTYFGTAYDSANRAASSYLRVNYPQFDVNWGDDTITDDAAVKLFDGDPDSGGVRVYDVDHTFANSEIYLQNGLIRFFNDEGTQYPKMEYNIGAGWVQAVSQIYGKLQSDVQTVTYMFLKSIESISPEKIILNVRFRDSAVEDDDYYLDGRLIMERGHYNVLIEFTEVYPIQDVRWLCNISPARFAYCGNGTIGDNDIDVSAINTILDDNFGILFDDEGNPVLLSVSSNLKATEFRSTEGQVLYFNDFDSVDVPSVIVSMSIVPFSDIAHLFKEAEDATISASAREYIDAEHWGFTDASDMVSDAQPESGVSELDGDDYSFWTSVSNVTISQELTIKKVGSEATKIVVTGPEGKFQHDYGGGNPQDFSVKPYVGFWWYGTNGGGAWGVRFKDTVGNSFIYYFIDNWSGYRWLSILRADFTDDGGGDWTDIQIIDFESLDNGSTFYLDGMVVPYDGLWSEAANCTIEINEDSEESVGTYCTKIISDADGVVEATVTPISAIGKLTKFDKVRFYISRNASAPSTIQIRLVDTDGDYLWWNTTVAEISAQKDLNMPHSDSDLQSWTEVGTYDFTTLTSIQIKWTASGAGEIVYVDGLHEYIGTTTSRGRGETLSGGEAVVLDAQNEPVNYTGINAGTDLPAGIYLIVARAKDSNQVANDLGIILFNQSDLSHRNETNTWKIVTATDSYAYYSVFAHISDTDVSGNDSMRVTIQKKLATENTIFGLSPRRTIRHKHRDTSRHRQPQNRLHRHKTRRRNKLLRWTTTDRRSTNTG